MELSATESSDDGAGIAWMHHARRWTWDRTKGGAGRRNAGSSGVRGSEVEMSIRVVSSENVLDIVIVSRGLPFD